MQGRDRESLHVLGLWIQPHNNVSGRQRIKERAHQAQQNNMERQIKWTL
jgi:hypothetical protein